MHDFVEVCAAACIGVSENPLTGFLHLLKCVQQAFWRSKTSVIETVLVEVCDETPMQMQVSV